MPFLGVAVEIKGNNAWFCARINGSQRRWKLQALLCCLSHTCRPRRGWALLFLPPVPLGGGLPRVRLRRRGVRHLWLVITASSRQGLRTPVQGSTVV